MKNNCQTDNAIPKEKLFTILSYSLDLFIKIRKKVMQIHSYILSFFLSLSFSLSLSLSCTHTHTHTHRVRGFLLSIIAFRLAVSWQTQSLHSVVLHLSHNIPPNLLNRPSASVSEHFIFTLAEISIRPQTTATEDELKARKKEILKC